MTKQKAPSTYRDFVERFPELGRAWDLVRNGESKTRFDVKTQRLLKLAVAVGAMREGAVHSAVRKAIAAGASADEVLDVVALAASTLGFPSAVAVFTWVRETL
ncbi:MAG TPA: carboxymuconolactone decarboxylase family protein [Gemmatimonadota bacterium]|nr:carboxymuconolactone decarboxylase family protein [Gemmatimonadota bacterium]